MRSHLQSYQSTDTIFKMVPLPLSVCKETGQAEEEKRRTLVDLGNHQRELGRFSKALDSYRAAEAIRGDMELSVQIAGTLLEQGRAPLALLEWNASLENHSAATQDQELLAVVKLCHAISSATVTLQHRIALNLGLRYYEEYVSQFSVKDWKKRKVRTKVAKGAVAHIDIFFS